MAIKDWPGGVISKTPVVPGPTGASGVWTLDQVAYWAKQGAWPYGLSDPYYEYVSLLLTGNGTNGAQNNTFLDSSSNNFTITRNGNTTQGTFSPYGANWSNYFDGSGDFLSTPDNAAFDFGTGAFAIECWFNLTADAPRTGGGTANRDTQLISAYPASGASQPNAWALGILGDVNVTGTAITFGTNNSAGVNTSKTYTLPSTLQKSTWHHIVVCRSGTNFAMFYDGVRVISDAAFGNDINNGGWLVRVGALGFNTYEQYFPGYISNMRVVKGSAVYDPTASTITVPTAPLTAVSGTSLLTCQSNRFIDNSSNNFTLTVNGNTSVQRFSPFNPTAPYSATTIGGSGYFDGSGDYLSVPDNNAFDFGSGNFTVECWFFAFSLPAEIDLISKWNASGTAGTNQWLLYLVSGAINFIASTDGTNANIAISGPSVSTNQWNHLAAVRNGNAFTLYVNGVAGTTVTSSGTLYSNDTEPLGISYRRNNGSTQYPLTGYMSNIRIVKGTAVYTSNFTPPTAPLTAVTNTSLLLNFTNAGIPDAAMMNDLETVENAQVSTSVVKYGTGSLYFDGNGDYLQAPSNGSFDMGSGNFTVECWVNPQTTTASGIIRNPNSSSYAGFAIGWESSKFKLLISYNGSSWAFNESSPSTYTTNSWYHVALVRNGSTAVLYINGTSAISVNVSTNSLYGGQPIYIGYSRYSSEYFNGYIDDLRITKGYARYTSNFTPPTAAFPTF